MNKLFTKIAAAFVGMAMAIGVGVAVASNKEAIAVHAAGTATFDGTSSALPGSATAIGEDSNVTIMASSTNAYTNPARLYANTTITVSVADSTSHYISSVTYNASSTGNYVTYAQNAAVTPNKTPTVNTKAVTWTYTALEAPSTWTMKPSSQTRFNSIVVTYADVPSEDTPVISLDSDSILLIAGDNNGKQVSVTATGFGSGTMHYEWSTNDSNISLTNNDSATVTVLPNTAAAGSATVNVKVWGGDVAEANALTDSVSVNIEAPKTVTQALSLSGSNNVYTKGIVSRIQEVSISNGNATYFISDDGTETNELEVYRGKYVGNVNFTSADQIQVGDTVIVFGNITTYGTTVEYAQGNYLISLKSEARLSLAPTSIEVTVGTNAEVTATPSNFETGTIVYSFDEHNCATLSHVGNTITVHGEEVGTHTFTVTGKVNNVTQATAELEVSVVAPYPTKISRTGYASYTDTQTFAEGTGSLTVTYSDESQATKHLGDVGVKLYVSGVEVNASSSTAAYVGANAGSKITYTENGHTVETNTYQLNVSSELEVTSFEGIPEDGYLIIDSTDPLHSADITVNYKSLNGEPELSIVSSNPAKLSVSYDESMNEYNAETKTGLALFTITAGSSAGQFSVTVSVTYGSRTETKSFSIDVRGEAPVTSGSYNLLSSYENIVNGDYVIAAKVGNVYYAMTNSLSGGKFANTTITVSDGKITSEVGSTMVFSFASSGAGFTIKNGANYVGYSSGTNLSFNSTSATWTASAGTKGTIRLLNTRPIIYRTSTYNVFGAYAASNVTAAGTEYYDLELFKYEESSSSSFDLVSTFVSANMHMNDVSIGNRNDTGACKGESGYYLTAKRAWNDMVEAYEGEDVLETVFRTSFEDAYARYMAWADAMNDAGPFDGYDEVHTNIRASAANIFSSISESSNVMALIIVIISMVSITAIGGYFFIRKRKEQ